MKSIADLYCLCIRIFIEEPSWKSCQDNVRTGSTPAELKQAILDNLYYVQSRIPALATTNDWYMALAYAVRDRMMNDWIEAFGRARRTAVSALSAIFRRSSSSAPSWATTCSMSHDIHDLPLTQRLTDLGSEPRQRCLPTNPSPASAMAASDVSPPVTWSRSPP